MSGICGLFNLDTNSVKSAELRAMTTMLAKRGPERTDRWRNAAVGLGHTLLATTPELLIERQPVTHAETDCVVTADVRLDNRGELLDALELASRRDSLGDAALILHAYLKWGEACLDRLLGDFAFAIFDPRDQKLFCARDHFGMRPFYYHHAPEQRFVFASSPQAILVLPQVPYRINEGRVADFLVPELEWIDYTSTFFEDVYRLPPGHKVTVTPAGIDVAEFWKPQPGPELGPMSDEDYEHGFLESVRCSAAGWTPARLLRLAKTFWPPVATGHCPYSRQCGATMPIVRKRKRSGRRSQRCLSPLLVSFSKIFRKLSTG
jgi:asparagine synthase (glutamine-hydrolysing)